MPHYQEVVVTLNYLDIDQSYKGSVVFDRANGVGVKMDADNLGYIRDVQFRELVSKQDNELIKTNVYSVIKLTKTVSEFCSKLAGIKEQTAASLNNLVETYRKKTSELKKRTECQNKTFLDAWDNIMSAVENESKDLLELGQQLQKCVVNPLANTASNKKNFCKKSFAYRDYCQLQISKAEEDLNKKHKDYSEAWHKFHTHDKETLKDHHIALYHNCHNSFLLQLSTFNSMNETQFKYTVPDILEDIEKVHQDLNQSLVKYLVEFLGVQKTTLNKLVDRMESAVQVAKKIDFTADINSFIKFADQSMPDRNIPFKKFYPPKTTKEFKDPDNKQLTYLSKSLVVDQFTEPMLKRTVAYSRKRKDEIEVAMNLRNSQLDTSQSILQHDSDSLDPRDLSIDINDFLQKRNDVRDQRTLIKTLEAQMTLFTPEILSKLGPIPEEYANDVGKGQSITIGRPNDTATMANIERSHKFMEHNFIKPAQCSYCKGFIVGLVKQGLKCRRCRMNIHKKCKRNAPFCTGSPKADLVTKKKSGPVTDDNASIDEDVYEEIDPEDVDDYRRKLPAFPPQSNIASADDDDDDFDDDYEHPQDIKTRKPMPIDPLFSNQQSDTFNEVLFHCVALYDFEGEESNDLTMEAGDKIEILTKSSDEWWEGICKGKRGYFPSSFVERIEPEDTILRILYDFNAEEGGDEMQVEQGQIVILVEDEGNGWTVGKSNGKIGAFPSTYAERL